jgi:UDP-3-O-[3-hydroxymyristoyl] N-acetylglucosamine deacetylase
MPLMGHLVVNRSGHAFNHAFLEKFFSNKQSWETSIVSESSEPLSSQSKSLAI